MTIRTQWHAAYRAARAGKLEGRELYQAVIDATGDPEPWGRSGRFQSCLQRMHDQPTPLAVTVLNRWGARSGWRSPPMSSPRFESWRRNTARTDALYARLRAAGRLAFDAGGWVSAVAR